MLDNKHELHAPPQIFGTPVLIENHPSLYLSICQLLGPANPLHSNQIIPPISQRGHRRYYPPLHQYLFVDTIKHRKGKNETSSEDERMWCTHLGK